MCVFWGRYKSNQIYKYSQKNELNLVITTIYLC